MRIGSLVELVNDNWNLNDMHEDEVYPIKGVIYTIRGIEEEKYLLLEEIVNSVDEYLDGFGEPAFTATRFREIQPPMTISIESILESELV